MNVVIIRSKADKQLSKWRSQYSDIFDEILNDKLRNGHFYGKSWRNNERLTHLENEYKAKSKGYKIYSVEINKALRLVYEYYPNGLEDWITPVIKVTDIDNHKYLGKKYYSDTDDNPLRNFSSTKEFLKTIGLEGERLVTI